MGEEFGEREFKGFDYQDSETAEVIGDLLRALRRKKGFGLFFVQCNPAQGQQVMTAIRERFPQKRLAGWSSKEIYNYSWKGVPPLLSHLNRQRETFKANLPIPLIFLVPSFVIDYFVQRAPDFFDWRSGFFKFVENSDKIKSASEELVSKNYQEYRALTQEQRIERILEIKDKILQLDSSDGEHKSKLLREQGRLFKIDGDSSQALDCFDCAVTVNPNNYKAWNNKGGLLYNLERYEEAIESYNRVLEIKPDYHHAWNNRGDALRNLGRNEEAIESYNRVLEIKPDYHHAWIFRGNVLSNLGRNQEAIENYDRALEIKPDYYYAWSFRGNALRNLEHNEEAIESYDRALEIKPDYHYAWKNRGDALRNLGRNEEAIESYERALEIKPYAYPTTSSTISL